MADADKDNADKGKASGITNTGVPPERFFDEMARVINDQGQEPYRTKIARLYSALTYVNSFRDGNNSVDHVLLLLAIMLDEGKGMVDYQDRTDLSYQGLVSTMRELSGKSKYEGVESKALIALKQDPLDKRYKQVFLTDMGKKLRMDLATMLDDN